MKEKALGISIVIGIVVLVLALIASGVVAISPSGEDRQGRTLYEADLVFDLHNSLNPWGGASSRNFEVTNVHKQGWFAFTTVPVTKMGLFAERIVVDVSVECNGVTVTGGYVEKEVGYGGTKSVTVQLADLPLEDLKCDAHVRTKEDGKIVDRDTVQMPRLR